MTILWCAEFLGDYQFPYPSSSGTLAYNIVTRLLDKKINVTVADPVSSRHRTFITSSNKALGRLYATYNNRDFSDLVSRLKPEKVVTDDVQLASMLLATPNNPEIVLIARSPEIPKMYAEGFNIVVVSNALKDAMDKWGIKSTYIPLGVDFDVFKKTERQKKGFVFGCVCRNKADKNFYRLLEAYRMFNDTFKDAAALAVHTDNGAWDVRRIAKKLGIQDYVFFGNWPADLGVMARVYNTFDAHINIGGREWSAFPVLESMACGVAQIVSDYGVLREYAEGCGILVPSRTEYIPQGEVCVVDAEVVSQAMEKMWINHAERAKAGEAALKKAGRYSWDKSAQMWEELLKS